MPTLPASPLRWRIALPVFSIVALAVWGLATRTLTVFQLVTWAPILYSLIVFTAGAIAYRAKRAIPGDHAEWPFVSILVPAHNEAAVIGTTVAHLLALDYPAFEVIVIDDHSSDGTSAVLRDLPVTVVTRRNLPNRGKSEALNAGLEVACGEIVCVFDADSMVTPDFLKRAVAPMRQNPGVCGVQTQVRMYNRRHNFLTQAQDEEFAIFNEVQQLGRHVLRGASALGGNGQLTRRDAIRAVGGWSPAALTEDLDLTIRLFLAGQGRIAHCSEAIVWQEGVTDLKALIRQRTRWAEGMLRCFGEFAPDVLGSKRMGWGLRLDALYVMGSVFLPLLSISSLLYTVFTWLPHYFVSRLPDGPAWAMSGLAVAGLFLWSACVTHARDRAVSLMPALRFSVYIFHWVPAMLMALGNVARDVPVVWAKTEHVGAGLVSSTLSPSLAPVEAAVASFDEDLMIQPSLLKVQNV